MNRLFWTILGYAVLAVTVHAICTGREAEAVYGVFGTLTCYAFSKEVNDG